MKLKFLIPVLLLFFCCIQVHAASTQSGPTRAHEYLTDAIREMGGESALQNLKRVRFEAIGHRNMLEESERPEGPYIIEYHRVTQLRDLEHQRWRQTTAARIGPLPEFTQTVVVADEAAKSAFGPQSSPGSRDDVQSAEESLELGPERVLFTALAAADLRAEADTVLQSIPHHVVDFTWKSRPVRLFLNSYTALPTAVEWKSTYQSNMFWSTWGDVTTRLYYSLWWLCPGGIHYPLQWDFFRNEMPDRVLTITEVKLNGEFPDDSFAISPEEKAAFAKRSVTYDDTALGNPKRPAVELVKDVVHIPGSWNVTLVRQADGIVVLEAPISSGYSTKVLAEAERRWPGVPVKAVISTSDAWPHVAGIREYAARGIPIYALDMNLPILKRFVSSRRTLAPDSLEKSGKKPNFHVITGKTLLGQGANRLEIYPLRGETSERQMMVYFPEHKLLYGSDPFQQDSHGYFYPQTVWELVHAVEREKLSVETFFMMHIGPTKWSELSKPIQDAEKPATPGQFSDN